MRTPTLLFAIPSLLISCGGDDAADPDEPSPLLVQVGPFDLAPGEETDATCFSHTLDNKETLYVSRVSMVADNGFHHSNWLFVPDHIYDGPDGAWQCEDRNFDTALSAVMGGVLFAQSTQATVETQEFRPGAVIAIPPGTKLVANLHLLNASTEPLTASTELEITTIPEEEVTTRLAPIYLQYLPLTIPPHQDSHFSAECDLDAAFRERTGEPVDVDIHYILPHYHAMGRGISLEAVGGSSDGEVVFANQSSIGEPLGRRLDQPFSLDGATGLRFGCDFTNPTDSEIGWGIGDQEMCIVLGFAASDFIIGGGVMSASAHQELGNDESGVAQYEGECTVLLSPRQGG